MSGAQPLIARVAGIGLAGPGLRDWRQGAAMLRGEQAYEPQPWERYKPERLPANERRRATSLVRLAFQACEQAVTDWSGEASALASVFASSGGDMDISTRLCAMLAQGDGSISPTQFHNSVHNAAAGYWSIATAARGPSCSLSGHDATAAAGLVEALSLVVHEAQPVLLAVYDIPTPPPLHAKRPISEPLAWALVLLPAAMNAQGSLLRAELDAQVLPAADQPAFDGKLGDLQAAHPAGRGLPLLQVLARGAGSAELPGFGYRLQVLVE